MSFLESKLECKLALTAIFENLSILCKLHTIAFNFLRYLLHHKKSDGNLLQLKIGIVLELQQITAFEKA